MGKEYNFKTTAARSNLMKKIRSTNTKPELKLRKKLWSLGIRYRLNVSKLPGKPDIVINRYNLVIFIDGEFWHGFNWNEKKHKIKSNRKYWIPKIEGNIRRDKANNLKLKKAGYKVIRFWEKDVNKMFDKCIKKIIKHVQNFD